MTPVIWSDQHREAYWEASITLEFFQRGIWFGIVPVGWGFSAERQKPREVGCLPKVTQLIGAEPKFQLFGDQLLIRWHPPCLEGKLSC